MERYCLGKTNVTFHRCTFNNLNRSTSQEDGETFDAYLTDLEDLISRCEYRQMDKPEEELLRDRIVCGVRDDSLMRQQFLSKTDLSLVNKLY